MKRFIGFLIIIIGIAILLNNLGLFAIKNFYSVFWSSLMIAIGIFGLFNKKRFDVVYVLLVLLGILFVLGNMGIITFKLVEVLIIPIVLVVIGFALILNISKPEVKTKSDSSYIAIFGGVDEVHKDDNFVKNEITAIFGGANIDYRTIKLKNKKAYIDITSIFGGVKVRVPSNVRVIAKGIPIFGGVENKMKNVDTDLELIINYNVICGGIEISD